MKTYQKLLNLPTGFIKENIPHHIYETYFSQTIETQENGYMETPEDIADLVHFINNHSKEIQVSLIDHINESSKPSSSINFEETHFYKHFREYYPALMETLLIWYNG